MAGRFHPDSIPRFPGAYALSLLLYKPLSLEVGHLGTAYFPAGRYIYCGSALGSGGLKGRLGHYLWDGKHRNHWHIDYLLPETTLEGIYYAIIMDEANRESNSQQAVECRWSQALAALPGALIPQPGFGASDCQAACQSHLVVFPCISKVSVNGTNDPIPVDLAPTLTNSAHLSQVKITFITPKGI
jgi:histidyl-tRNA synthetase